MSLQSEQMHSISSSIVGSIFRRKGGETGKTRLLSADAPLPASVSLLLYEEETVILISSHSTGHTLLTNHRIIAISSAETNYALFENIADATVDFRANASTGAKRKDEFSILTLMLKNGSEMLISFESGAPYWGILSVLKWIVTKQSNLIKAL